MAAPQLRRLDKELVKRKIVASRTAAHELIAAGVVEVGGMIATKPATQVTSQVSIRVVGDMPRWASRGAHKLIGALDGFADHGVDVTGLRVLDAGASTGGFTDVLLDRGASQVVAVDVGYGQLDQRLAQDPRVTVLDRTNIRFITPEILGGKVDAMVGDLSFISLTLVLPAILECVKPSGFLLPMVKPQFEVGKDELPKGAVVSDPAQRAAAVLSVARFAQTLNTQVKAVTASPLPGPAGNVEYFLLLHTGSDITPTDDAELEAMVNQAVANGPQSGS